MRGVLWAWGMGTLNYATQAGQGRGHSALPCLAGDGWEGRLKEE